ncbi:MAG: 30S ribosomal protein S10 [Clostridia bacterium]|nr:30S ribosomal protein S10 [Clostridia bacterium]
MAVSEKIKVRVYGYDHKLVELASKKIVDTAKKYESKVSGPIPLPTDKEIITILRAVHKYKDSREQFEQRTHKRLIVVLKPNEGLSAAIKSLELPAGVHVKLDETSK